MLPSRRSQHRCSTECRICSRRLADFLPGPPDNISVRHHPGMFRREGSRPREPHIRCQRLGIPHRLARIQSRTSRQHKFLPVRSMPRRLHGLDRRRGRYTAQLRLSPYDVLGLSIACLALPQSHDGKRTPCPVSPAIKAEPPQTSRDVASSNLHPVMLQQV